MKLPTSVRVCSKIRILLFKNILLYTNCGLAKIPSVHIPWMFYFDGHCINFFFCKDIDHSRQTKGIVSRDSRKLMKTNHWIEERTRKGGEGEEGSGRQTMCTTKKLTKNFLYFTLSCITSQNGSKNVQKNSKDHE